MIYINGGTKTTNGERRGNGEERRVTARRCEVQNFNVKIFSTVSLSAEMLVNYLPSQLTDM